MTDDANEARELAAMRWNAVEAANTCPGLSAAERRVLIALVTVMDSSTLACFPSETRLAALLDMSLRSVANAKEALKARGMIDWVTHGGPRHLCRYTINFDGLRKVAEISKRRADRAVEQRKYKPTKMPTFRKEKLSSKLSNDATQCIINDATGCSIEKAKHATGYQQHATECSSNMHSSSSELSHLTLPLELAQPLGVACALKGAAPPVSQDVSQIDEEEPKEGALEKKPARPRRIRHFPKVWEAFEGDSEALERLELIPDDLIGKASADLARFGKDAARKTIVGHAA